MVTFTVSMGNLPMELGSLVIEGNADEILSIRFSDCDNDASLDTTSRPPLANRSIEQLERYFAGRLEQFDLPMNPAGTPFQQNVWTALKSIPYGNVVSYSEIARAIGHPQAVRAVGQAIKRNPLHIVIPCHRVIGTNQTLTGYAAGLVRKSWLLMHEKLSLKQ
jgi:methylated-DNA-[protein]-cysteine S-methyltransferase